MKLTEEQSRELFRRTGNYLKEACDQCGKPLAEVRYMRRGEPGEWCSELCRDGEVAHKTPRGGRPRKYKSDALRMRADRQHSAARQKAFRQRRRVTENRLQPTGTEELANAILAFGYPPTSEAV